MLILYVSALIFLFFNLTEFTHFGVTCYFWSHFKTLIFLDLILVLFFLLYFAKNIFLKIFKWNKKDLIVETRFKYSSLCLFLFFNTFVAHV